MKILSRKRYRELLEKEKIVDCISDGLKKDLVEMARREANLSLFFFPPGMEEKPMTQI